MSNEIIEFQKLYLKHYGKKINLAEAEKVLHALVSLIELVTESKQKREG